MDLSGWLLAGAASICSAVLFVPKELWKRGRVRLVDRLDHILQRRVSRFNRRYRDFVLSSLRFIDLKGLATVGFYTPELDEAFVDVSLVHRPPHQVPDGLLIEPPGNSSTRQSIGDFLDHPRPMVLAVIGAPGSGKTSLLRHTARGACRDHRGRRRPIPILLYLRDHVATMVSTPDASLPMLLRGTLGRYVSTEPPGWFEQRLENGECMVLLDGLDEVSRPEDRRHVANWIERLIQQYPDNDFVITSRPHGYRTTAIDGAVVLQVQSFTDDQVTRFVRGWYRALERQTDSSATEDTALSGKAAADDLLKRLRGAPGLYELTVNPLLLTMIANVHRYRGALPGSRADLYSEICQVMLWRRQEAKKLSTDLSGDKKETLLRWLAFSMMHMRVRDLPRDDVLRELRSALRRMPTRLTAGEFLAEVCSYGLIVERESGMYSFAHLTFQESLAASHIRAKNLVGLLIETVDDPWWRETTLLYVAQSDADPIVTACLDANSVTALSLAFDCAEQGTDLAPALRAQLHELIDGGNHESAEHRRLIVAVQVTRHLRDLIRTGHGGQVCARPISARIYQLYMEDAGGQAPDGHTPDLDEAVLGVRASDAAAFAQWVNEIIGGEACYRLPTGPEIDDPGVQRALIQPHLPAKLTCPWLHSADEVGSPRLWTPVGSEHPNLIDAATLEHHLKQDLTRLTPVLQRLLVLRSLAAIRRDATKIAVGVSSDVAVASDSDIALARDLMLDYDIERDLSYVIGLLTTYTRANKIVADMRNSSTTARFHVELWNMEEAQKEIAELGRAQSELDRAHSEVRLAADGLASDVLDSRVQSRALSRALDRAFRTAASDGAVRTTPRPDWRDEFRDEFAVMTHSAEYATIVSIDTLADETRNSCSTLIAATSANWVQRVTSRLTDNALPAFDRQRRLTAQKATSIRLAALCLAAEADVHCTRQVGDTFRSIAAGVTLLERRATGQSPGTETILLART